MLDCGSTSIVERISPGVILKRPIVYLGQKEVDPRIVNCFSVEREILKRLGPHPRVVRYLGTQDGGILLGEASHGNLQAYLDSSHPPISPRQRLLWWCMQLAEGMSYIHSQGVVHSDLSGRATSSCTRRHRAPETCCYATSAARSARRSGLDGLALPDGPFYSPVFDNESSPQLDIFGMGSVFYTIATGTWPCRCEPGTFLKVDDRIRWEEQVVYPNFRVERFPDVEHLPRGDVIMKCWKRQFATAQDVSVALQGCSVTP